MEAAERAGHELVSKAHLRCCVGVRPRSRRDASWQPGASGAGDANQVRMLTVTLREWDRASLIGAYLPVLVSLPDAPAVALALSRCEV